MSTIKVGLCGHLRVTNFFFSFVIFVSPMIRKKEAEEGLLYIRCTSGVTGIV